MVCVLQMDLPLSANVKMVLLGISVLQLIIASSKIAHSMVVA